eukprot:2658179-Rhodomonas_salina.1
MAHTSDLWLYGLPGKTAVPSAAAVQYCQLLLCSTREEYWAGTITCAGTAQATCSTGSRSPVRRTSYVKAMYRSLRIAYA